MMSAINTLTPCQGSRTVLIAGAGASMDFGLPSVARMTELVDEELRNDPVMQELGGVKTYTLIKCQGTYWSQRESAARQLMHGDGS